MKKFLLGMGLGVAISGCFMGFIAVFGQNARALFASSANALGGQEDTVEAGSAGSSFRAQRKAIRNFGANSADEAPAAPGQAYFADKEEARKQVARTGMLAALKPAAKGGGG
jgi:hypothetical protein